MIDLTLKKCYKYKYVWQLPINCQNKIKKFLKKLSMDSTDVELGLNGKVIDLTDTINIKFI